jgi:hypothetical protein
MKKIINILIFSLILFSSCTKVIDFDLNSSMPRLVVEGSITTETKSHIVKLTKTSSYYYNQIAPVVSGAEVTISDGTNTFVLTEEPVGSGIYKTANNVKGEIDKTYTLTIVSEGETYTASSKLAEVAPIDSIDVKQKFESFFGEVDSSYTLSLWATEPAGSEPDYYFWKYSINNVPQTDTLRKLTFQADDMINGSIVADVPVYSIPQNYIHVGDTVTLFQYSTDKKYLDFVMGFMYETAWRGSPFDGPPANAPTNISNGAVGYFYASDVSKKDRIIQ